MSLMRFWLTINKASSPSQAKGIQPDQHIDIPRPHDNFLYFHRLIIKESNAGTFSSAGLRDTMTEFEPPLEVPNILIILPRVSEEDELGLVRVH